MKFVIFHGSLGSNSGNWFPRLKSALENFGQEVICPQYPVDDFEKIRKDKNYKTIQNYDSWVKTFESEILPNLEGDEKICFVCHSMGNLFALHVISKYKIELDSAVFVSPFFEKLEDIPWQYVKVNETFYKDLDFENLKEFIPTSYVLFSKNDPYVEPKKAKNFGNLLDSSLIELKKAQHMNAEVNMVEFPLVFDLCMSRIDLSTYQKFCYEVEIKNFILDLINSDKKFIKVNADQITDEGQFHFWNVKKNVFATYPSDVLDWDPESLYFLTGRIKSREGIRVTRVIILKDKIHLQNKKLQKQIELDLKSGIEIRLIDFNEFKKIGCPEDFGVWDSEYVVIVDHEKDGSTVGGTIDTRVKTMLTAQNWRDRIIRGSVKIEEFQDLKHT